jgi:hypothetical protein
MLHLTFDQLAMCLEVGVEDWIKFPNIMTFAKVFHLKKAFSIPVEIAGFPSALDIPVISI